MPYKVLAACGNNQLLEDIQRIFSLADDEFTVSNVLEADSIIATISSNNPDIVLYDIHFASKAAPDVLSIIKADPTTSDIPILAIADFLQPEHIQSLFHAGADDFYWYANKLV